MKKTKLTWKKLKLEVKGIPIMKIESGGLNTGSFTAFLGTCDESKTLLLNALAGRVSKPMNLKGKILFNGGERTKEQWMNSVSYIEKYFHAYMKQTVFETIKFTALLKNRIRDENKSTQETNENILNVINILDLTEVKDSYLCNIPKDKLKRVSIGLELIRNPEIIILDEPTFGLDYFNALNIIYLLKRLSFDNKVILLTINQPSYSISELFDEIFIISKGNVLFRGNMKSCIEFFAEQGYSIPPNTDPCNFILELTSINTTSSDKAAKSHERIDKIIKAWKDKIKNKYCHHYNMSEGNTNSGNYTQNKKDEIEENNHPRQRSMNFYIRILINLKLFFYKYFKKSSFIPLLKRNIIELYRDESFLKVQIIEKVLFTLLLGFSYLHLGYKQKNIQSRTGVIFFILLNTFFLTCGSILRVFPEEKRIIMRERNSGLYNGFSVYASKFISLTIYHVVFSIIYITAVYWMVGLNPNAGRFFVYLIIQISSLLFAIALGITVGTICPTEISAQITGTTLLIVFHIFGGVFINPDTIPGWLRWTIWVSPVNYAFRASMKNQYYGLDFDGVSGYSVIQKLNITVVSIWTSILSICLLTLFWGFLGAFLLHYITRLRLQL